MKNTLISALTAAAPGALHRAEPGRAVRKTEVRKNRIVERGRFAYEDQQVAVVGLLKRRGHALIHMRGHADLDHPDFAFGVVGIHVGAGLGNALVADIADPVFSEIAHRQRGDQAFAVTHGIHYQERDAIGRRQKGADDVHCSSCVVTESELGIAGEVVHTPCDTAFNPIDMGNLSRCQVIVQLDDETESKEAA